MKTIKEWAELRGIKIIDPDGFDRNDPNLWDKKITEQEFYEKIMLCTIMIKDINK